MSAERVERRLAAILAADVAGYSRLMGQDEAGTLARFRTHYRELIDPKIAECKGRIVKNTGDGFLAEFQSVVEAVACAVAVQRDMADRNTAIQEDQRMEFRIGINLGDVMVADRDIHGDGVNVAARLEGLATPGGICISAIVRDQVQGRLDCGFEDMGEQNLKNIARPVRVYRVRPDLVAVGGRGGPSAPAWRVASCSLNCCARASTASRRRGRGRRAAEPTTLRQPDHVMHQRDEPLHAKSAAVHLVTVQVPLLSYVSPPFHLYKFVLLNRQNP